MNKMKKMLLSLMLLIVSLAALYADKEVIGSASMIVTTYTVPEGTGAEKPDKDAASSLGQGIYVQVQNLNGDWTALSVIDRSDNAFEEGTSKSINLRFLLSRNSATTPNLGITVASEGWKHESIGDGAYVDGISGKEIIIGQFRQLTTGIVISSGNPTRLSNSFSFTAPRTQLVLTPFADVSLEWDVATGMMSGQYVSDIRVEMTAN